MKFEEYVMSLIISGGSAKSGYIEAIHLAKNGQYDEAGEARKKADQMFEEAHKTHFEMMNYDYKPESLMENMLLIEDKSR